MKGRYFFSVITHPLAPHKWQINSAEQKVFWEYVWVRAEKPGYEWLLKDPLLWAVGWLFRWQVDAIFLGEDHFMLLSMFNLYSKVFPSKWQSPTVLSKRLVNQKPYEICGISMPPFVVPPRERKSCAFQILIFSTGPLSEISCCGLLVFEYYFLIVAHGHILAPAKSGPSFITISDVVRER